MSEFRPEEWSDMREAVLQDLAAGRGDRERLTELLEKLERSPGPPPSTPRGPAPITDQMDAADLARGHAKIRAARSPTRAIAAAAGIIVAAGALGFAYRELQPRSRHQAPRISASPVLVTAVPSSPQPSWPLSEDLSVEKSKPARRLPDTPTPVRRAASAPAAAADDEIRIIPVPRVTPPERTSIARHRPTARLSEASRKPQTTADSGVPVAVSRLTTARRTSPRTTRLPNSPQLIARGEPGTAARDVEFVAPRRTVLPPASTEYTPMSKERVLPEPRRRPAETRPVESRSAQSRTSESRTADYAERRSTPRVSRGNFDDRTPEESWPSLEREEPRSPRVSREPREPREPVVKRRICVDTGWLAGDLCPHTAVVLMPESRVPRRTCRVHMLP